MKRYEDSTSSFPFFFRAIPRFFVARRTLRIKIRRVFSSQRGRLKRQELERILDHFKRRCNSNKFFDTTRDLDLSFLDDVYRHFHAMRSPSRPLCPSSNIDRDRFPEGKQCKVTRTTWLHPASITLFFSRSTGCETKNRRVDTRNRGRDLPFIALQTRHLISPEIRTDE